MASRHEYVVVRNRTSKPVTIIFDREEEVWAPFEERIVDQGLARHAIYHSAVQRDIDGEARIERLCVVPKGRQAPPDIDVADVATSFPIEQMAPQISKTGETLRPVVLDISEQAMRLKGRGRATTKLDTPLATDPAREAAEEKFADDVIEAVAEANDAPTA